jgi:hypothetical protein
MLNNINEEIVSFSKENIVPKFKIGTQQMLG